MRFDYSKTINEQLDTFNYYKDRFASYQLEIIKDRDEIDRYKKIIAKLENYFIDMFNKTQDIKYLDDLEKLRKLKEDM